MKIDMSLREEGFHLCTKLRMEAHVCEYVLRAVPEDVIEETLDVQNEEGCDVACFDAGFCGVCEEVTCHRSIDINLLSNRVGALPSR